MIATFFFGTFYWTLERRKKYERINVPHGIKRVPLRALGVRKRIHHRLFSEGLGHHPVAATKKS